MTNAQAIATACALLDQGAILNPNEDRRAEYRAAAEALRALGEQSLSISFSGEASENFAEAISSRSGWYVRITPQEGEPFDAILIGWDEESGRYDSVRYLDADPDSGLPVDGAEPKNVLVRDVQVY